MSIPDTITTPTGPGRHCYDAAGMPVDAKFVVCPECLGEGSFGPGFVWTQDQIEEDPEEFAETQRMLRVGQFDKPCATCGGKRVVVDIDEDGTTAEQRWAEEVGYRAECAAEIRVGC